MTATRVRARGRAILEGKWANRALLRDVLTAVLLFALYLALYLTFLPQEMFVDEMDVFKGGFMVARGKDIYKVVISQHMPISYYIAAVVALFGPDSFYQFRLGFYLLLSALFVAMYFRHRRVISPVALIAMPVFFLLPLHRFYLAYAMVSDHWQGIGMVLILLELWRYSREETPRITPAMAIWVSVGIQLSFGTAFMAAFAILPIMLAVLAMQLWRLTHAEKAGRVELRRDLFRQDGMLVGIVLLPMAVLLLWYLISGNLGNFIEGAYTLNREIYPKYMGGMGESVSGTFHMGWERFKAVYGPAFAALKGLHFSDMGQVVMLISLAANIAVTVYLAVKKKFAAALGYFAAAMLCGLRDFSSYHGLPYMAVSSLSLALVFAWCMRQAAEKKRYLLGVAALLLVVVMADGLPGRLLTAGKNLSLLNTRQVAGTRAMLNTILDEGDTIHITDVTQATYPIDYQRATNYSGAVSTPWTWEVYGEREIASLRDGDVKVVFYHSGATTWGYAHDDYGAEFVRYLEENYTHYSGDMYIRNDYWEEAMQRLAMPEYRFSKLLFENDGSGRMITSDQPALQYFVADNENCVAVALYTSCFMYHNPAGLTVDLISPSTGAVLATGHAEQDDILDEDWTVIPLKASLTVGRQYALRFTADPCEGMSYITPAMTALGTADDQTYAVVEGERTDRSLCFGIASERVPLESPSLRLSIGGAEDYANLGAEGFCEQYLQADRTMQVNGLMALLANYGGTARGKLAVTVMDEMTGEVLAETIFATDEVVDLTYTSIPLPPFTMERGGQYVIRFAMTDDPGGALALAMSRDDPSRGNSLNSYADVDAEEDEEWDYCLYLLLEPAA